VSQLLSKVTVTSCSFYIKCSMCPPCWATPLTNGVINEMLWQFASRSDISQGSVTHFRIYGIFAKFSWFRQWNSFKNRLIFDKVEAYQKCASFFSGHPVHVWCTPAPTSSAITSRIKTHISSRPSKVLSNLAPSLVPRYLASADHCVHLG